MITIRKATALDAKGIFDLRSRSIIEKCSGFYPEDVLLQWTQGTMSDAFIQDVAATFYVSEYAAEDVPKGESETAANTIIGSGKINLITGMLDAIFVDPSHNGKGAAKTMISFLEALARQSGLQKLILESTLNAAPFYRRCGFSGETQSTYHSPRGLAIDCIPMCKSLK
jgi:N-acetylglutamate synthase-like GNAT family acetyltransferase